MPSRLRLYSDIPTGTTCPCHFPPHSALLTSPSRLPLPCLLSLLFRSLKSLHSVLAHLAYKRSLRNSSLECSFALLNWKRKVNIEGINGYCFSLVGDFITSRIELNWLPMTPFLVYTHGTRLTFGKPFVRKQYGIF